MTEPDCTARRHDGPTAYTWHGCRCPQAREQYRLYRKRRREGRQPSASVPAVGTARRLQALVAIGYTWRDLSRCLGVANTRAKELALTTDGLVYRTTAARVADLYEKLSATPGPSKYGTVVARRYGFVPPLAWDDIDDPTAKPTLGDPYAAVVDDVAIERALRGEPVRLTKLERLHAVQHGLAAGMSKPTISVALRMSGTRLEELASEPVEARQWPCCSIPARSTRTGWTTPPVWIRRR